MKKIVSLITTLLISFNFVYGGELQQKYEKEKFNKFKDFEKYDVSYIIKQDLKNYRCFRKSFYGELMDLINNADEANYQFLLKIKKNYNNCSKNFKCWEYVDIDDYHYNWLDTSTKNIIWFNNMVFISKT